MIICHLKAKGWMTVVIKKIYLPYRPEIYVQSFYHGTSRYIFNPFWFEVNKLVS